MKTIKKPTHQQKIKRLRNKADKLLQQVVRSQNSYCIICGKYICCGHHYFPKSTSTNLRYDLDNLIPICASCHFSHHNGNPEIHNTVNNIKGEKWVKDITKKRHIQVKPTIEWYEEQIEKLRKLI